jgi:hypothetical protein
MAEDQVSWPPPGMRRWRTLGTATAESLRFRFDFELPRHDWAEITAPGNPAPVAFVCQRCGERRPRGRAVIRTNDGSDELRDQLQAQGFDVLDSPYAPGKQVVLLDGRYFPGPHDTHFCPAAP